MDDEVSYRGVSASYDGRVLTARIRFVVSLWDKGHAQANLAWFWRAASLEPVGGLDKPLLEMPHLGCRQEGLMSVICTP